MNLSTRKPALNAPVEEFKGIGPTRARHLEHLGIKTLEGLLLYFPRAWQDRRQPSDLSAPNISGPVITKGRVVKTFYIQASPKLGMLKCSLNTGERAVDVTWFKHLSYRYDVFKYLKSEITRGTDLWVIGRGEGNLLGIKEIHAEEHYLLDDPRSSLHVGRIVPIYPLTEGISQKFMRELAYQAVTEGASLARDILPFTLVRKRGLLSIPQALKGLHFPDSESEQSAARTRLAYEELLLLELAWIIKRRQTRELKKNFGYEIKKTLLTPFKSQLGFTLTGAQTRVIKEIFSDMQRDYPMTRLLQGDVGSGKTVVALAALLLAVENGYQGAFMAPTEILADQHLATIKGFLKGLGVKAAMLTSRLTKAEREKTLSAVRKGEVDILIGTHALLEEDVQFPRLKLIVIDEQHRFGVRQRNTLRQKGSLLDLLVMTATPIPRTLALALYGDLDVSTLDEMPPGKVTAETAHASEDEALDHVKAEVAKGRQAYIVYPIIEESSHLDLRSAKIEFKRLSEDPLQGLRVALIHGAMPGKKKAKIMADFAAGEWDVLVATPVIEVGIDVHNATVMVIQNADHFGMASLHQLRGRIGRGTAASKCFLVATPQTPQAQKRVATLVSTSDGFRIGEEDLKLRGPGEFMGTAQHGELTLKVADLRKDAELLAICRTDAEETLDGDPRLKMPEHAGLKARLLALYQKQWNWIDIA